MKNPVFWMLASLFTLSVCAQSPTPKPSPEHKKLEVWTGDWKYEGTSYTTPLGKAGKFTGAQTGRMILNGFFVELRWNDKGDFGDEKGVLGEGLDVYGYDSTKKAYTVTGFDREGGTSTGTLTVDGNTWKQTSSHVGADGKINRYQYTIVFSEDAARVSMKCELQSEGGKWIPNWDLTMTKVGRAR